jgi:NAD(P)-dependent dehydrogenase (short-subunit alcohol dehydrogenase family)
VPLRHRCRAQDHDPIGRVAKPEEIAEWSAFLAAKGAATATGADFVIDGGYTAGGNAGI